MFSRTRFFLPHPGRGPLALPVVLAALLGLLALPGCHNAGDDTELPPLRLTSDMPTHLPPTPALFAAAALPALQVGTAALPPRPPDPSQVARQAAAPAPAIAPPRSPNAGLIVCDPVSVGSAPALAVFGTACGRWLDLAAAGQPELGQTPFWEARSRCWQEMHWTDFALSPAQAVPLAAMTGVTHAACGTLTGTPARCTLTYQLYALPGGTPVGPPLVQTGTEQQVAAALPALAKALDSRLGVPTPRLPVADSAADLTQIETIGDEDSVSDADLLTLSRLSAHSPLAGM